MRTILHTLPLAVLVSLAGCGGSEPTVAPDVPAQAPGVEGMKWLKEKGYVRDKGPHRPGDVPARKKD